jgi:CDP-paratose 2-epimerase
VERAERPAQWDAELDPYWLKFSEMIGNAAYWAKQRGKKDRPGRDAPIDPNWLRPDGRAGTAAVHRRGRRHAFPGTSEAQWEGWRPNVERIRDVLKDFNPSAQVWITETGYSTWRHDERPPAHRVRRRAERPGRARLLVRLHDLDPRLSTGDGFHADERDYHFGLKRADGGEKLLYRLWAEGGLEAVRDAVLARQERPRRRAGQAGADHRRLRVHRHESRPPHPLERPARALYDNLSRPASSEPRWLKRTHGDLMRVEAADVRDAHALRRPSTARAASSTSRRRWR